MDKLGSVFALLEGLPKETLPNAVGYIKEK